MGHPRRYFIYPLFSLAICHGNGWSNHMAKKHIQMWWKILNLVKMKLEPPQPRGRIWGPQHSISWVAFYIELSLEGVWKLLKGFQNLWHHSLIKLSLTNKTYLLPIKKKKNSNYYMRIKRLNGWKCIQLTLVIISVDNLSLHLYFYCSRLLS